MQWVVKSHLGQFDGQPEGFRPIHAIENRFFVCECPTMPNGDFVVEYPEIFDNCSELYMFPNGKRTLGIVDKRIQLSDDMDKKYRRTIMYTDEQIAFRTEIIKWIALNVFLPDKKRMLNINDDEVLRITQDIENITDDRLLKDYVKENLYYNL